MKKSTKKAITVIIIVIIGLLLVINLGLSFLWANRLTIDIGTYIKTNDGCDMIIMNDSLSFLHTENENIFSGLQTGDKILIVNKHDDTVVLTPGGPVCYFCLRLGKGDLSDIPEEYLEQLRDFGYIS